MKVLPAWLTALFVVLTQVTPANAQEGGGAAPKPSLSLEIEGLPAPCATPEGFRRTAELPPAPTPGDPSAWTGQVRLDRDTLEIRLRRPDGALAASRTTAVASEPPCDVAAELLTILLAAHVGNLGSGTPEPTAAPAKPEPGPASATHRPLPAQRRDDAGSPGAGRDPRAPERRGSAAILAFRADMLPVHWGGSAGFAWLLARAPIGLGAELGGVHHAATVNGGSAGVWNVGVRALAGFFPASGSWQWGASAVVGARLSAGSSQGARGTDHASLYSAELGVRLEGWRVLRGHAKIGLRTSAILALPNPIFTAGSSTPIYEPSRPQFEIEPALGWEF